MQNTHPFCHHHLIQLMEEYDESTQALDRHIHGYFKKNRALGSKDRAFIANTAYGITRWQSLFDHLIDGEPTWEARLEKFLTTDPSTEDSTIPTHTRHGFPEILYKLLVQDYGEEKAQKICLASNEQAPTTVRTNTLQTTREELLATWSKEYPVTPGKYSETAIHFAKRLPLFCLPEFHKGFFEVQDEGSQLVAELIDVKPGEQVLDYCAGSGGKALALAPKLEGKGQIYLHDIREHVLLEARRRLKRAGIQNGQCVKPDSSHLSKLKKKFHWVLADVPCSGTGTLRRNPDMKWKFSEEMVDRLVGEQRLIFERALSFVRPDGYIVYATCSLLRKENEEQVEHFLKTYPIELVGEPIKTSIDEQGMDGFFGAVFIHKQAQK